jgi:cytochrome c oxidase assembly protein Cox11
MPGMINRARLTAFLVLLALLSMGGVAAYSVTLYRLFCQATGFGGTTQRADRAPDTRGRFITVFFDTTTSPALPWRFVPLQRRLKLRLGEEQMAYFEAENLSDQPIEGRATFNVTPEKTGIYFKKIQCFCFNAQTLKPHEKVSMPVSFFVDPALANDPNTEEVQEITLSYTFFRNQGIAGASQLAALDRGTPPAQRGEIIFAQNCAGCHTPTANKVGPRLGGIYGRAAGSVAGYPYSAALRSAHVTWEQATLERWLANPQAMLPGALMPMHLDNVAERADVIAYLRTLP